MMSGIPGPPPGGGPLNGSSLVPNTIESFSDQNLLPDVVKSELNPIKSEQVTIKSEVSQNQFGRKITGVLKF